jgi:hypothetical protein
MTISHKLVALLLVPTLSICTPALAQQRRLVDADALQRALDGQAAHDDQQRDHIRRVLGRDDVGQLAARLGLDVAGVSTAVATLSGADLASAATHAQAVEQALAGGSNTIVISATTALLILIVVILLVK